MFLISFWFFNQKWAYDMRISDGSSDLCSSDLWVLAFFREPVRVTPRDENLIIAPADGLVTLIQNVPPPRELLGPEGLGDEEMTRISIFMSVFDVHINR